MLEQALFLSCGLMSLGIILGIVGALGLRSAAASLRWHSIPGEVTASGVEQRGGRPVPQVRYRYTVGEKTYTGARLSFRSAGGLPGLLASPPPSYIPGAQVTVYYDPADPGRSVLEPGAGLASYLPVAAGGLFFILGLVALAAGIGGLGN